MACTLPLFGNGNLLANCHHDAGTDRVCGCKGRSWSVTGVLARGIRKEQVDPYGIKNARANVRKHDADQEWLIS